MDENLFLSLSSMISGFFMDERSGCIFPSMFSPDFMDENFISSLPVVLSSGRGAEIRLFLQPGKEVVDTRTADSHLEGWGRTG